MLCCVVLGHAVLYNVMVFCCDMLCSAQLTLFYHVLLSCVFLCCLEVSGLSKALSDGEFSLGRISLQRVSVGV